MDGKEAPELDYFIIPFFVFHQLFFLKIERLDDDDRYQYSRSFRPCQVQKNVKKRPFLEVF